MVMFGLGTVVGGIIGFVICAVLSVNNIGRENRKSTPNEEKTEEDDVGIK